MFIVYQIPIFHDNPSTTFLSYAVYRQMVAKTLAPTNLWRR